MSTTETQNGAAAATGTPITLARLEIAAAEIEIVGLTPLIPHRFSQKAKAMMLAKQQGRAKPKAQPKDPEQDAFDSAYWIEEGVQGIPSVAFKSAIADAARFFDRSVTIETLKRAVFVKGEGPEQLVRLDAEWELFEANVRLASGVADLAYRYKVWPWSATLTIEYIASSITPEALVALVDAAGRNGVGDWRPSSPRSKTGVFGQFEVAA